MALPSFQDGLEDTEAPPRLKAWLSDAAGLLDADLRTLRLGVSFYKIWGSCLMGVLIIRAY